jgi:hypothetical protein
MASNRTSEKEAAKILGSNERLIRKLHPDVFSFLRYYGIGIVLLIWTAVLTWMVHWGYLKDFEPAWFGEAINPLIPILLWAAVAALLGGTLVRGFHTAFQAMFWVSVVLGIVLTGLVVWYWNEPAFAPYFALIFGYVDAVLSILIAEIYRRAFSYFITDMRIVIRYKLLSSKEVNIRFEKIEDWKIDRPLLWRIFGVGTIRPYTGTEDGKADADRSFDAPDECMYGIRHPQGVKKLLVDLVLERDQIRTTVEAPVVEVPSRKDREPEEEEEELEPVDISAPEPVEDRVVYYKPAPEPEPEQAPPARNYERVTGPSAQQDEGMSPPSPHDYEDEEEEEEKPSPVRIMYPQAEEPASEPRLHDEHAMDFEQPRADRPAKKKPTPEPEEPEGDVYDEGKPRSL